MATPTLGLIEYIAGIEVATTSADLEKAIQMPCGHPYRGPTWRRICNARIASGLRIVEDHPNGRFVPRFGRDRLLQVCGQSYRVGRGQNSAGARYVWTYAEEWARDVLRGHGFSARASYAIWSRAFDYPHRALEVVADALSGKLPDPRFNRLIPHRIETYSRPVRVQRHTEAKHRAHRPCKCDAGWLWDWGCGWTGYATFINWHCDRCPKVYTEYVTQDRLVEIRKAPKP